MPSLRRYTARCSSGHAVEILASYEEDTKAVNLPADMPNCPHCGSDWVVVEEVVK